MQYDLVLAVVDWSDDPMAIKAGEVIESKQTGHVWSAAELVSNDYRMIRVDLLPTTEAVLMAGPIGKLAPKRRRDWRIDIDKLPHPEWFKGKRKHDIITLTRKELVAAVSKKP